MENEYLNGLVEDTRLPEEKQKDYSHTDFMGGGLINWIEKEPLVLSQRKQSTSWSCGAQSLAKLLEFINKKVISATPPYRYRKNFPNMGMSIQDIGSIAIKKFTTTEELCPSQNMTEEQMNNAVIPEVTIGGFSAYYFIPVSVNLDMDVVAQALDNGHPLVVCITSNVEEWNQYVPTLNGKPTTFGHFVSCYPSNYTLYDGEKAIYIDDSSLPDSTVKGQRILTQTFLKERCAGIMALKPSGSSIVEFKHTFPTGLVLRKGSTGVEVVALQTILVKERFLKPNLVTGFYGDLTTQAVKDAQQHYADSILAPAGLTAPTGQAGYYTLRFFSQKYG